MFNGIRLSHCLCWSCEWCSCQRATQWQTLAPISQPCTAEVNGPAGDNTYTYSTAVAPTDQTFTYNTQMAAKPDAYTYSTAVEPQDNTYTYLAGPQAAGQEEFTYSTNAGGPALYTYNAAPEAGGLTTFNAQEVGAQGSVINGYVEGDKPELWYNVPIGEIHPLDTAGRWDSGQVTSINPDSTTRASAPLTLTGERADGTVASEDSTRPPAEDRLRAGGAATTKLLELPELMQLSRRQRVRSVKFNAQALAKKMHVSQARLRRIYSTPVSGVGRLSAEERKLWANHVILAAKKKQLRHMVDRTPVSKVKELPKKEQMEWAKHVLKRSKLRWAQSASRLVRNELHPAAKAGSAPHLRDKHHISVEPLPARGKAGKVDTFGMPELRGPWSGGACSAMVFASSCSPALMWQVIFIVYGPLGQASYRNRLGRWRESCDPTGRAVWHVTSAPWLRLGRCCLYQMKACQGWLMTASSRGCRSAEVMRQPRPDSSRTRGGGAAAARAHGWRACRGITIGCQCTRPTRQLEVDE